MKNLVIAVLTILVLAIGTANATTSKTTEAIDHSDFRPLTNTPELIIGEKFLTESPYELSSTMFEYGVQYELKKRHPHYWSLVASLLKGSTSVQSGSSCGSGLVAVKRTDPDEGESGHTPTPTPVSSPACISSGVNSSLDLVILGLGLKKHWHKYNFKIQPYITGGINLVNADLRVNGQGNSGNGLGIFGGVGLTYDLDRIVFNLGLNYSIENVIGYNFGGPEIRGGVGFNF